MTDGKDLEAEIHPLKSENRKVPENTGGPAGKEPRGTPAPQTRLSRCRTAAFFLSLFTCLLVVFVVSFIIPCPDRPASQGVWRIDYNAAVAYDFLATEDVNKDKIQDILFLYKNTNSSRGNSSLSCADEGFSCPCTFVAAVSGANGSILWERPVAQDGAFVECGVLQPRGSAAPSACIVLGRPGPLVAVDTLTGKTLWSQPSSFGGNASILSPLLRVPDLDADGAPDLLVLVQEENQVNGYIYSGGTGQQVSPPDSLGVEGTSGSILHVTRAGAHYVLVPCGTALCSRSVKGLYEKVSGRDSSLKSDPLWEDMLSATSHRLLVHSSGAIRYLMNVPGKAGDDLLLVSAEACMLLDGQDLTPRWTFGTTQVLRKPVLGHYKPNTPAVLVENGTGSDRQVLLLDLGSGALLWSQALPGLPGDPPSASLPTADHRSAFFFWGVHKTTGSNQTEPGATGRRLYMLHPTLPSVLLELDSVSAPIVAFQVVLLELGRHAACVLLTGPASPNPPGLVSVTKQKVQDLVLGGRVVRLAEGGPESDQAVRDRLSHLRYRSEA
ncbi:protein FAM234A [Cervus canadensis]|uniref:protein FAM234A n=1 Tax=Cervus canadensis TaxID=1574408 RepID=UPI001CA357D8|nr:protein FAM234A [Cervus canadensis]XP_043311912.1 protein FAM234A [Cervus canadensis]XP_043311913.1 protein FAM234A [Cervus canadensis]XP_043311914.1 protein FAM234A [Cervus canadensis]XP_043311915.1 protein FAM234A [Cervus canadensis]